MFGKSDKNRSQDQGRGREARELKEGGGKGTVAGGSGVDNVTITRFAKDGPRGLLDLKEQLRTASYQPRPVKRVWIPKPGTNEKRPLGIPTVRDRIVQTALRMVIEPIFERRFAEHSYGFRPGRGCKDALRRVQTLPNEGHT
jgi:RNA-directed DNA polymerase